MKTPTVLTVGVCQLRLLCFGRRDAHDHRQRVEDGESVPGHGVGTDPKNQNADSRREHVHQMLKPPASEFRLQENAKKREQRKPPEV